MKYEEITRGRITEKGYQNWSLFGTPGIPYENTNNEWGFRYGPPIVITRANNEVELRGGNYVSNYKEFLDLFSLTFQPEYPESLRIVGKWPSVDDTESKAAELPVELRRPFSGKRAEGRALVKKQLSYGDNDKEELIESTGIPIYTMIDGIGNIIVPDGDGWYHPTGWYLDYAGEPIFLYPSRATACKINNTGEYDNNGVRPGGVMQKGGLSRTTPGRGWDERSSTDWDTGDRNSIYSAGWSDGHNHPPGGPGKGGRTKKFWQKVADGFADYFKEMWATIGAAMDGDWGALGTLGLGAPGQVLFSGDFSGKKSALLKMMQARRDAMKKVNDGIQQDYRGRKPAWGARIGMGEHCMNLTLDMKQSMIYGRPSTEDKTRFLGYDMPGGGETGQPLWRAGIDYSAIEQGEDNLYRLKRDRAGIRGGYAKAGEYAEYNSYVYKATAFDDTLDPDATGEAAAEFEAESEAHEVALGRLEDESGNLVVWDTSLQKRRAGRLESYRISATRTNWSQHRALLDWPQKNQDLAAIW